MSDYDDKELQCVGCPSPFTWTAGEQRFLAKLLEAGKIKSITPPKRCPDCRAINKAKKEEAGIGGGY